LARLPMQIRGFGPVKKSNYDSAMIRRKELLKLLEEEHVKWPSAETTENIFKSSEQG